MSTNIINGGLGAVIGQTQKVMLIDSNGNAIESLGGSSGVSSINGASGTVTLAGAGDITVSTVGSTVTVSGSGFGTVSGPVSSTDKAIAIFNGTNGQAIQNSNVVINGDVVSDPNGITVSGTSANMAASTSMTFDVGTSFNVNLASGVGTHQLNVFFPGDTYTALSVQSSQIGVGKNILLANPESNIAPFTDLTVELGTSSNRFSGLHVGETSIDASTSTIKQSNGTNQSYVQLTSALGNLHNNLAGHSADVYVDATAGQVRSVATVLGSSAEIDLTDSGIIQADVTTGGGGGHITLDSTQARLYYAGPGGSSQVAPSGANVYTLGNLVPTVSGVGNVGTDSLPYASGNFLNLRVAGSPVVTGGPYLPLTGGVLTGAVSGTSFSGTSFIGDVTELNYVIDGGGSVIASGSAGVVEVPFNATVLAWDFLGNISGSLSCDVRRSTYAAYSGTPFASTSSIVGSEKPTITTAFKGQDTSITTWSGIAAGDILNFHVDATPTNITRATLAIKLRKTS